LFYEGHVLPSLAVNGGSKRSGQCLRAVIYRERGPWTAPAKMGCLAARQPWLLPLPPAWDRRSVEPGRLFRRCDLFSRRSFDLGLFTPLIGVVQELVNQGSASVLLDPRFLRFLLFSEELVINFPAHWFLHP